ncbi:MAG: DUF2281 domain-containing protein [Defluviitaleaceae bacterium]|nr:DUF2281 domain-containing protein [Defluviitaleaceae bacterium]MCL2275383.1 DUF2281 domain-containing protein [Defluviitaleaceae bacterium]
MYAIKALYDGVSFKPKQPIAIKEHYEVIITFVEPVKKIDNSTLPFKRGCMKDKMWMANDFNAPLDDFAEYM